MRIAQIGAVYIFEKRHIPARSSARNLREQRAALFIFVMSLSKDILKLF